MPGTKLTPAQILAREFDVREAIANSELSGFDSDPYGVSGILFAHARGEITDAERGAKLDSIVEQINRDDAALPAPTLPTEPAYFTYGNEEPQPNKASNEQEPGFTMERIEAALAGRFDPNELSPDEWRLFDDLQWEAMAEPTEAQRAYFKELGSRPGDVGTDEYDRLVRVRPDGTLEIIPEQWRIRKSGSDGGT
jgi:hypothetical protein